MTEFINTAINQSPSQGETTMKNLPLINYSLRSLPFS